MSGKPDTKRAPPWAIRNVTLEARNAATSAAKREGLTLGEWLDRAIRQQIKQERHQSLARPLEETLAELVKQMQADREERKQDRQEMDRRISAIEALTEAKEDSGYQTAQNPLARLYGLLRGK